MSPEDKDILKKLKESAPYTWRCCSNYYIIAAKYGISLDADDFLRNMFIDKELEKEY